MEISNTMHEIYTLVASILIPTRYNEKECSLNISIYRHNPSDNFFMAKGIEMDTTVSEVKLNILREDLYEKVKIGLENIIPSTDGSTLIIFCRSENGIKQTLNIDLEPKRKYSINRNLTGYITPGSINEIYCAQVLLKLVDSDSFDLSSIYNFISEELNSIGTINVNPYLFDNVGREIYYINIIKNTVERIVTAVKYVRDTTSSTEIKLILETMFGGYFNA